MSSNAPSNIVAFRQLVLLIAQELYERLPTPIDIDPNKFDNQVIPPDASYEEAFDRYGVAADTIRWLSHEGFLRYQAADVDNNFYGVVLTRQGFALLESVDALPNQPDAPKSFIERIKAAAKESGGKVAVDLAAKLVAELIKGLAS